MAVRLTGLASGLDTDAIVQELVSAYQTKVDDLKKDKQMLEWKDEAWSDMNSEIYSFYTKQLSTLRYQKAFLKQTTAVSDTTKATVTASGSAVTGTQSLKILNLAKSGYITGSKLNSSTTSKTTLAELRAGLGSESEGYASMGDTGTIKISVGGKETTVTLNSTDTLKEAITKLNDVDGITASYDETNQRVFVSAKNSGTENDISLTGGDISGISMLQSMGIYVSSSQVSESNDIYLDLAVWTDDTKTQLDTAATYARIEELMNTKDSKDALETDNVILTNLQVAINSYNTSIGNVNSLDSDYYSEADTGLRAVLEKAMTATVTSEDDLNLDDLENYLTKLTGIASSNTADGGMEAFLADTDELTKCTDIIKSAMKVLTQAASENEEDAENYYNAANETLKSFSSMISSAQSITKQVSDTTNQATIAAATGVAEGSLSLTSVLDTDATNNLNQTITDNQTKISEYDATLTKYENIISNNTADEILSTIQTAISAASFKYSNADASDPNGATVIEAEDASIILNGASYTSNSNTLSINGLTITATGMTGSDDKDAITVTTSTDSSGIYDSIKNFLKEYNTLVNKMNKLYNAASAKDYEPLTDDEKDEMSDEEIEKWETKIKDAILRRDSTLSSTISMMHNAMQTSYYILNGKAVTYSSKDGAYKYNGKVITDTNGNNISSASALETWAKENGAEKYNLSSFGIGTLGYLNAASNEEYAYHIDGDTDDADTGINEDKLLKAIQTDPDTVSAFFSALFSNMYSEVTTAMKHTTLSSSFTIYNDKQIDSDIDDVDEDIEKWQERLEELQDQWYERFSQMETALSELQSQQSSLASLLGTSS